MLKMNLTLTEGVAETIAFEILSKKQEPVDLTASTWWAVLKLRGSDEAIELRAWFDASKVMVDFPALEASPADWELWRADDSSQELFLGGAIAIFPVLAIESIARSTTNDMRTFAVLTQDDKNALLVKAMPGNAALACLDRLRSAYREAFALQRVIVTSLPPVNQANDNTVYYVNGTPWLAVDGQWIQSNAIYGQAEPGMDGLLHVDSTASASSCAPISRTESGHGVKLAEPGSPYKMGAVSLSDDFYGNDPNSGGLYVRRASAYDQKPGLITLIGNERESSDPHESDNRAYTAAKTQDVINETLEEKLPQYLRTKLSTDASNLAPGLDIIVDSYHTQAGGYMIYKSGWCEMYGMAKFPAVGGLSSGKVDLPVKVMAPFILISPLSASENSGTLQNSPPVATVTSFGNTNFNYFALNASGFFWRASGFVYQE